MKKFFGMLVVALSLVLVSCGAKDFGEGEFSFTIPGSEFQKMAAARSADSEVQFYFIVIAQIKGSKGFYQKQVLTTSLANDFEVNPNIDIYSTAFKDMSFEFSSIPVNQKYTVMMDVLARSVSPKANPDPRETWGLPYTAEKSEITVRRNTVTQLEIEFKSVGSIHRPFDIGFNITYMDGGSEKTKFYTNTELQGIHNINNWDKYDVFPTAHFFQEGEGGNSRLYISDKGRSYPVKSVVAQFAETSHFKQGGEFEMILHGEERSLGKSSGGKLDFTGKILPDSDGNFIVYPLVIYEGCNIYTQENQFELKIQDFLQTGQDLICIL